IALEQIRLRLTLIIPIDHLFLLEMREALDLSSKFDIEILDKSSRLLVPLDFELDYLGRRFPLPAMNVRQLSFSTSSHERLWGEYLSDVKDLKIRNPLKGNWERLGTYWKSFPDESAYYDSDYVEFQLVWCSP
ncbi:hypothetical protein Tco_0074997, partial [Tanacetum coccineum]